ncbi:ATP-binding protein [Tropicibacter sp. Alg240-R139]|uniref:ATP-binding protein n=1 Tax=Tropicibacter sp. Alg240-R139 TaxID=2305991 RepID=UPI0013E07F1B|nr:ATP-binding protein [Tropicibacter sp. Alg240-R139]
MPENASSDAGRLAAYERQYSPNGLLIRYARGRVANFSARQIMTVIGGVVLGTMNSPWQGALVMCLALLGEAVDCFYLRHADRQLAKGVSFPKLRLISTFTAGFQAATISVCVVLAWQGPVTGLSPLFSSAFLAGAAINAGLVLPFHRPAAIARLGIYATTAVGLFAYDAFTSVVHGADLVMNTVGAAMLAYMVALFLQFVVSGFHRHKRSMFELTEKGKELINSRKEAERLSLVARNANDSVIVSGPAGEILWVNDAFSRITGYTAQEAVGRSPGELLNSPETDPKAVDDIREAILSGQPYRGEILNNTKDGRTIWVETNLVPVLDDNGQVEVAVAVERDITQAKTYAREMAAAREAAVEGARAKAEFLATMSHEIRTPMNGVIGMTEVLLDTHLTIEQREFTDTIRSSARALLTIINDILDLSKLDAQKVVLSQVDFDLTRCFEETLRLLRPQAKGKGLTLTLDVSGTLPKMVHADDGRLRQILINLIGNAIKFTESGGVTVTLSANRWGDGHLLSIDVIDTGIGIPPDKIQQIFERFSQADAATTRLYGGTGLGLTISQELVQIMGGEIRADSTEGAGSRFCVELPVGAVEDCAGHDAEWRDGPTMDLSLLAGKRVLVAEDNRVNRLLMRKFLADTPVDLSFAHDGQQAICRVEDDPPDLIFMDMSMPVMGGIDATRRIREMGGKQPAIVALTANAFDSDKAACRQAGMDDFLSKPVRRADLLACMMAQFGGGKGAA